MPDLLIELFSEEIPARMQARARDDLRRLVTDGLVTAGLTYASAGAFSTPRRLTLTVEGLTGESRPVREERKGPAVSAPQPAIDGFLRSTGLTMDQLERRADKKGETFYAVMTKPGREAADIVAEVLETTIRNFPWPKSMRWGSGALRWVRPLHAILCLLTDEGGASVVPVTVDHLTAGNTTEGHRFMAQGRFSVSGFDDYRAKLLRAKVMLDSAEREAQIWNDATNAAFAVGGEVVPDAALLAEVAGLVEWPVVLMGRIGADFMGLPPEVLQTSMREHQKFFSVKNAAGQIDRFITVANIETKDNGATILAGNQKVLSARLSDARFFWENDLRVAKAGMGDWLEGLASVTFHNKLGSQADRVARIAALAREIAPMVGADADLAERAAIIAKVDLESAMVAEFPELQGVMGMYYAREAGCIDEISNAARDHWAPKGPDDPVPREPVAIAVALSEKADTLGGFWKIHEKPTGSKDPFALRRAALGIIRIILENGLSVPLGQLLIPAFQEFYLRENIDDEIKRQQRIEALKAQLRADLGGVVVLEENKMAAGMRRANIATDQLSGEQLRQSGPILQDLVAFVHERLKVYLKDEGIRHDVIDACLAMPNNEDLNVLAKRARALQATLKTDDGANLIQGFKRANNLWTQAMEKDGYTDSDAFKKAIEILNEAEAADGVEYSFGPDIKFAENDAERALFAALDQAESQITPAMAAEDFTTAMTAMATLRAPIDAFFTATQINAENPIIRRNRLNLLHRIRSLCGQVADLTKLDG